MRSRCAAVGLLLLLVLAGLTACGDDSASTTTAREPAAESTAKAPRPSGRRGHSAEEFKGVYADTRELCAVSSREKVAEIVGSASTRRKDIARTVAKGYKPRLRKKAYDGCLAGLK